MSRGTLYGVGVGPGDPELMTVKAVRVLRAAKVVAFFAKRGKPGNALTTASAHLPADAEQLALNYPYTVEVSPRAPEYVSSMRAFYEDSAARIAERLDTGLDVVVLCEGDPMFYGSYMYLHDRLAKRHRCQVVPGITSFAGCAASAGLPLVSTDRVFSVIPATLPEEELEKELRSVDAAAIIKLGRHFKKVRRVLERLGRADSAMYFEHGTTEREVAIRLSDKTDDQSLYFALILLPHHDGGPYRQWDGGKFV
jgi:precorrin-2 C(20)-methyltransferase